MTMFLWVLVVLVGIPLFLVALSICLARFAEEIVVSEADPMVKGLRPEDVPGVPAAALRRKVADIEAAGLRGLLTYTLPRSRRAGMNNFVFVLTAANQPILAEAFYIRCPWLVRLIHLFTSPKDLHFSVVDTACMSVWEDDSRLMTSATRHVVSELHPNDVSQVMEDAQFGDLLSAHRIKLEEMTAQRGAPRLFHSEADYVRFYDARCSLARRAAVHDVSAIGSRPGEEG